MAIHRLTVDLAFAAALALVVLPTAARAAEPIRVESVLLELIEQSDVPSRDPGVIESLAVKEGDLVEKNDTLIQLDTTEAELAVEQAKIEWNIARQESKNDVDVRFAKKALEVAEAELQRALDSVADYAKSVSETELDRLRLTVEKTRLEIEQAEHVLTVAELATKLKANALAKAEQKLDRLAIRAPIDGLVAQVYRRHGEWVEPGQQVVRILRIDSLRVEGFISLGQLAQTPVGSPVEVLVEQGDEGTKTFPGTLVHVSPEVDPVNNQVRIWAEIKNPDMKLRPGMRGALLVIPNEEPESEDTPETDH